MSVLSMNDPAVQTALQSLDQQVANMVRAGETAERINEELARGYVADSSSVFQQKVQAWCEHYQTIMKAYQQLTDATSGTRQTLTQAEDEAQQIGGNWGGDNVYSVMSGS
jgi:uncharacterized protein YukE